MPDEVRVTNETTGGEKGAKPQKFHLLPFDVLAQDAELYGKGAEKYAPRNWEKGYDWSLSVDSLSRHLAAFIGGETIDPETGCHHLAAVRFHAAALMRFERTNPELNDLGWPEKKPRGLTFEFTLPTFTFDHAEIYKQPTPCPYSFCDGTLDKDRTCSLTGLLVYPDEGDDDAGVAGSE